MVTTQVEQDTIQSPINYVELLKHTKSGKKTKLYNLIPLKLIDNS
jgi:hypothetical protein